MSLSFICLTSLSPCMCIACEGYELSSVASSLSCGLESILCGPCSLCSMSSYKYSNQIEANFQPKGSPSGKLYNMSNAFF